MEFESTEKLIAWLEGIVFLAAAPVFLLLGDGAWSVIAGWLLVIVGLLLVIGSRVPDDVGKKK